MLRALYRLVLLFCPAEARRLYGAEMEEAFLHCIRVEQGRRARVWWPLAWMRGLGDGLVFALSARFEARAGRLQPGVEQDGPGGSFRRRLVRIQDVRSAFRLMRTRPLFAIGNVLLLALGLGATTAIFSVIHSVLLRPLPFPDSDRIVQVWESLPSRGFARMSLTEAFIWDIRDMNRSLVDYGGFHSASFTLTGGDSPQRVTGALVSVGFFRALGVAPVVGRLFAPGEDEPGAPGDLVMLSHALWTTRFAADRGVVGRTIPLDGRPYQVVGVLPPGTPWLDVAEVFVPFVRRTNADRSSWEYASVGRLRPGVTLEAARADLARVARELEATYPDTHKGIGVSVAPSSEWIASPDLRRTLWILLGAVGLLLVIACVNVTNLQLAHASSRVRETAVRAALGASRSDLIRERLTESLILSLSGAALAGPLAFAMLQVFKSFDPGGIPRLADANLSGWMLGLTVVLASVVGLVTGLVPALWAPAEILPGLRQGQRGAVGDRQNDRVRNLFVGAEVALSVVLLVGAGLLVKSLVQVLSVDRGFQTEQRLLATVSIPSAYPEARRAQIATDVLGRLEAAPQIVSVAAVSGRPIAGGSTGLGIVAADHDNLPEGSVPWATWRIVSKDYFKAMGLSLLAGRGFTEHDIIDKPWRVIVSKRLAEQLWPGESPIGKIAILWKGQGNQRGEVIGVVSDMRERGLENDPTLAVYFSAYGALGRTTLQLVLHTRGRPEEAEPVLRSIVAEIDRTLPVSGARSLEEIVTRSVATRRFTMLLLVVFAALAVVLAVAGVYGVLAYTVSRRTAEIGVRLALGASPGDVLRRVFARGMRPVLAGLGVGLAAMFWISQLMASLLFAVTPRDVVTYVAVTAGLLATAALGCYVPARRVLHVDPVIALRTE